jgi:hypothetical protein
MPQRSSQPFITPPVHVRLGPLTKHFLSGSRWEGADAFPAWQEWADDVEDILVFLQRENRLQAFLATAKMARPARDRDALLAEARVAFHLAMNGFRILQWEPPGEGTSKGEFLVSLANCSPIFIEVKQPGWEGEFLPQRIGERNKLSLADRKRRLARIKQGKFIPGKVEGGAVGSHLASMNVVRRNALPKFTDKCPNLAIVSDNCIMTPVGLPGLAEVVTQEFLHPAHDPDDTDDTYTYERLGGVVFLCPELERSRAKMVIYNVDFVENPQALPACKLPSVVSDLFSTLRDDTARREKQKWAGTRTFLDMIQDRRRIGDDDQSLPI